jgi:hypothetical protein
MSDLLPVSILCAYVCRQLTNSYITWNTFFIEFLEKELIGL